MKGKSRERVEFLKFSHPKNNQSDPKQILICKASSFSNQLFKVSLVPQVPQVCLLWLAEQPSPLHVPFSCYENAVRAVTGEGSTSCTAQLSLTQSVGQAILLRKHHADSEKKAEMGRIIPLGITHSSARWWIADRAGEERPARPPADSTMSAKKLWKGLGREWGARWNSCWA